MAVVLTILKIIGIVLLCVITLALFLIALVLFVPIRYRISAKRSDAESDPTAGIRATYLLHILCAGFVYDKETDRYVKVFGIRLKKKDKDKSTDKEKKHKKRNKEEKHDKEDKESYTIDWNEREEDHDTGHETVHEAEHKDDVKEESMSSLARFIESIVSKYESLSDDAERLKKNIRFWDRMAHDERNLAAFELIKIQVVKFLKRIAPRSVKGYVHFGAQDPATTGQILMYLSIIYPVLPRKLKLEPDFDEALVYGNIDIKGRLALIFVLVYLLRIVMNKDCKRMWRIYKRHSGRQ